jgi:hypothetical protein
MPDKLSQLTDAIITLDLTVVNSEPDKVVSTYKEGFHTGDFTKFRTARDVRHR